LSPRIKIDIVEKKGGKGETLTLEGNDAARLLGLKIGDVIDSSLIGKKEGKYRVSGGSDTSGFPMFKGVHGAAQKRILLTKGRGARQAKKGELLRVTIRGETISEDTAQINLVRTE
jgi:small subunit ribosomal protein S6e